MKAQFEVEHLAKLAELARRQPSQVDRFDRFDWYFDGDTPSYEDSDQFGGGSPHPTARLFVLSHDHSR